MTRRRKQNRQGLGARLRLLLDLLLVAILLVCAGGADRLVVWIAGGARAGWLVSSALLRAYHPLESDDEPEPWIATVVMAFAAALSLTRVLVPGSVLPHALAPTLAAVTTALVAVRALLRSIEREERPLGDALIVGAGPRGLRTRRLLFRRGLQTVVERLRFADEGPASLPTTAELEKVLRAVPVSEVYLAGDPLRHASEFQQAIQVCEQLGVPFALPVCSFRLTRSHAFGERALSDGYLHYLAIEHRAGERVLKRLLDVAISGVALALLAPLFIGVAILVAVTSRGPVLFRQQRCGRYGKPFQMLKFRSMVMKAERLKAGLQAQNQRTGPAFKMAADPRITAVGAFLRKFSIDELPQLFNVLRGDMSLVGPRPPLASEVDRYQAWQFRRLSVRPGLTCIWQVSGRDQVSFEEWMKMDMQYIDGWSLGRDLRLLLRTVPVVLTGKGAS